MNQEDALLFTNVDQAKAYLHSRPTYPKALFSFLKELCAEHELVWDCATGSGQAAIDLAPHFKKIYATDISVEQIDRALPQDNIEYRVASASESGLPDQCADLITVATALHWIPVEEFFTEVDRVLKPGGVLAVWGYYSTSVDEKIDPILAEFTHEKLGQYWSPRIGLVRDGYASVKFPYPNMEVPGFEATAQWDLDGFEGYLRSWSAVNTYRQKHDDDPVAEYMPRFAEAWGNAADIKEARWNIYLHVCRKPSGNSEVV